MFVWRRVQYLFIPAKYKDCYLAYVLNELSGLHGIIFVSTCSTAQRLFLMLRTLGYSVACLHGQMPQVRRGWYEQRVCSPFVFCRVDVDA